MIKNLLASAVVDTSGVIGTINPPVDNPLFTGDVNGGIAQIISTGIRLFFFVAALATLTYLLLGAFEWVTSGGAKEKLQKSQNKIQSAVIGLLLVVVVLVVVAALEGTILPGAFCIGLTCKINIPTL